MEKRWVMSFFLFFLFFVVGCTQQNVQPQQETITPQEIPTTETVRETIAVDVGEPATVSDLAYKVAKVRTLKRVGTTAVGNTADGIYVLVDMEIYNEGKTPKQIHHEMFYFIDDKERIFSHDVSDSTNLVNMDNRNPIYIDTAQPGVNFRGSLLFDVATDAEGLKLAILESVGTDEPIIFVDLSSVVKIDKPKKFEKAIPWEDFLAECKKKHPEDQWKNKALAEKFTSECQRDYATEYGLLEYCNKIVDRAIKQECYFNLAIARKDPTICQNFLLGESKSDCLLSIKGY